MEYRANQNRNAAAAVDKAVEVAMKLIAARRGNDGTGTEQPIRLVAADSRIGFSQLRRLVQPSRRPSSISVEIWTRLTDCYLRYLRRKLAELETEIARVEALHQSDRRAVESLLDEAEALARQIRALL